MIYGQLILSLKCISDMYLTEHPSWYKKKMGASAGHIIL